MKYLVHQYCEADGTEFFSYASNSLANSDTAVQFILIWHDAASVDSHGLFSPKTFEALLQF
jgi:hypothetical protein